MTTMTIACLTIGIFGIAFSALLLGVMIAHAVRNWGWWR